MLINNLYMCELICSYLSLPLCVKTIEPDTMEDIFLLPQPSQPALNLYITCVSEEHRIWPISGYPSLGVKVQEAHVSYVDSRMICLVTSSAKKLLDGCFSPVWVRVSDKSNFVVSIKHGKR